MHWSKFHRKTLLTLGKNTNNRIKNFNKQLKHILLPGQHLSETIQRLVGTAMQLDIDRAYKLYKKLAQESMPLRTPCHLNLAAFLPTLEQI